MARYRKAGSQMVEPAERYYRDPNTDQMRPVVARYRKVAGVMQEVWPLVPNAATITSVSMPFQNNRIELIINWTAPVGGAAVTGYALRLDFYNTNGSLARTETYNFAAGVLTTTQTNGGAGYQGDAGRTLRVTVTPTSTGGNGASTTFADVVVPQLPAPPAPTYSMSVADALATHTWSHAGGARVTGFELQMSIGTSAVTTYTYGASTTGAQVQPWSAASTNGGAVTSKLRTTGPGGVSAWVTVTGTLPSIITFSNVRFYEGVLQSDLSGLTHQAQIWYYRTAWVQTATATANGLYQVSGSSAWARDDATYCHMGGRGYNPANGWTNRWQQTGGVLKLPLPYVVPAIDSDTWRGSAWMSNNNLVSQGNASGGQRTGYWFYGNAFADKLNAARVGYRAGVRTADISIYRYNSGGLNAPVKPRLWLHGSPTKPTTKPGIAGGVDTTALARNAAAWCPFDAGWTNQLIDGWYRGVAMFHPNTSIWSEISTSVEYFLGFGAATTWDGVPVGTVRIWHDG